MILRHPQKAEVIPRSVIEWWLLTQDPLACADLMEGMMNVLSLRSEFDAACEGWWQTKRRHRRNGSVRLQIFVQPKIGVHPISMSWNLWACPTQCELCVWRWSTLCSVQTKRLWDITKYQSTFMQWSLESPSQVCRCALYGCWDTILDPSRLLRQRPYRSYLSWVPHRRHPIEQGRPQSRKIGISSSRRFKMNPTCGCRVERRWWWQVPQLRSGSLEKCSSKQDSRSDRQNLEQKKSCLGGGSIRHTTVWLLMQMSRNSTESFILAIPGLVPRLLELTSFDRLW